MKRVVVLVAVLAATACGQDDPPPPAAAPVTTTASTTTTLLTTTSPPTTAVPATAPPTSAASATITVPDMVGQDLQLAQDAMQAAGLYALRSHDALGLNRFQVLDRAWKVCSQTPTGGSRVSPDQLIDFGVVRDEEQCP